ncbi:MAG: MMPL family transporter, partial [Pseudomonadota bacterium]
MTESFAKNIIRWRWAVILLSLLAVFAVASGGRFLGFTNDYRAFFSEENPQLLAFEKLEKTYTKDDNVLFVLAPKDGNVFTNETLAAIEKLTTVAWQVPYSTRVDSISNFQHTYAQGDDLVVQDLYQNASALSHSTIQQLRKIALAEPLLVNRLVSPQTHVAGVNVTVQFPGISPDTENPQVVAYANQLAEQIRADFPQIDVYMTGLVLLPNAFFAASQHDMQTLTPLALVVILAGIGLLLRGWTGTFSALWVILFSIMTAMGFAGWLGIKLTPPSSAAPTIILTLGVANAVHILVTLLHGMRFGSNKRDAIIESLRVNMQPVFLTSFTTMIGFLSLNFSDAPPFHDLGNIVAMGVGASFLLAITFLPALMAVLPVRNPKLKTEASDAMDRFAGFVIRHRNPLLWSIVLVVVVLVSFLPRNALNENMVQYFDKSITFRTDTDFISNNLGGIYTINYSLNTKETGGVSNPAFLEKFEAFANWYRQQPEVIHVNSITDTFKRLNKNMHGDDAAYYRLPQERNLAAQYLLLYEMSLPYGLDLNNQINVNKSATRLTVTMGTLRSNEVIALEERAQAWLHAHAPEIRTDGSSTTVMFSHIAEVNIKSMVLGTSVALVLISFILIVALRSLRIGGISLVSNLV